MTALASVATRLDNAMTALQPLMTSAELNRDAAYARDQFGKAKLELVAAQRLVNGLLGNMALAQRRQCDERQHGVPGLLVIDGAPDIGTTLQGERVLVTFDRAVRIPRNPWPPVAPDADAEGGEY